MAISFDEVERIAKLARIKFDDQEKQKLQQELSSILEYVDQLKQVEQSAKPDVINQTSAFNLMRDDVAVPVENPEEFILQAPDREGNFVKVKSVLEWAIRSYELDMRMIRILIRIFRVPIRYIRIADFYGIYRPDN